MKVICISGIIDLDYKFLYGESYDAIDHKNQYYMVLYDKNDKIVIFSKFDSGGSFRNFHDHFKDLSQVRQEKLESIGI